MRHDAYLVMTCKHNPCKRIDIGSGKHRIQQWRCACGKNVALTDTQVLYVSTLQNLFTERGFLGYLSDAQEGAYKNDLDRYRLRMTKQELEALDSIHKAVISSFRMPEAS